MRYDIAERTLGEVALISSGKRPASVAKERSAVAAVPVVGGGGTSGYTEMPLTVEPVLITGRVGTLGKLHVSVGPVWPSDNALVIRPRPELISFAYLRYALGSVIHLASGMNRGAANPLVTQSDLSKLPIQVPSRTAQAEISSLLASLDDRIDLLRQTSATLESIAQALFKSWFIDFDPLRAKAEGREPEGMDAATAALFPAEFEESALGLIPKGWQIASVAALASLRGGKQLDRGEFHDAAPNPIFGGAGEMGRTARSNAEGFVLTVGRVGAYCGQFFWHEGAAWVNNNASHVRPHQSQDGYWLHQALLNSDVDKIKKGAAQPFVSNGDIENLPIILPDAAARVTFRAVAEPLYKRQTVLADTCQALEELRDTLLPRLISGKLRLPEAQAQREEAIA